MSEKEIVQSTDIRNITLNEKLYFVNEGISPPMLIQIILRGEGHLDEAKVFDAVEKLKDVIPAIEYSLSGKTWKHESGRNLLSVHQEALPKDYQADHFTKTIGENEELFRVHLFQSNEESSLLFRVHHSLMDGAGLILTMNTFFKLLRDEPVVLNDSFPKESDILLRIQSFMNKGAKVGFRSEWKGLYPGNEKEIAHSKSTVINLEGQHNFITGKIASWHTKQNNSTAKFLIPVDLRRHLKGYESVANLCCPIYLTASPSESSDEIHGRLLEKLIAKEELSKNPMETFGKITPSNILKSILVEKIKSSVKKNNYPMSGFISDLGRVELEDFSTDSFKATDFQSIPVFISLAPLGVIVCQHSGGTRIGLTVPSYYNLDEIVDSLSAVFNSSEEVETKSTPLGINTDLNIIKAWSTTLNIAQEKIESSSTYESLGGNSMNLILIINALDTEIDPAHKTEFLTETLLHGGKITPALMNSIISRFK